MFTNPLSLVVLSLLCVELTSSEEIDTPSHSLGSDSSSSSSESDVSKEHNHHTGVTGFARLVAGAGAQWDVSTEDEVDQRVEISCKSNDVLCGDYVSLFVNVTDAEGRDVTTVLTLAMNSTRELPHQLQGEDGDVVSVRNDELCVVEVSLVTYPLDEGRKGDSDRKLWLILAAVASGLFGLMLAVWMWRFCTKRDSLDGEICIAPADTEAPYLEINSSHDMEPKDFGDVASLAD